jgi:hypothetical protein
LEKYSNGLPAQAKIQFNNFGHSDKFNKSYELYIEGLTSGPWDTLGEAIMVFIDKYMAEKTTKSEEKEKEAE